MPDNIRFSNPDTIAKPPGYSHVVEVTGPGRIVYFAGQPGVDRVAGSAFPAHWPRASGRIGGLMLFASRRDPAAIYGPPIRYLPIACRYSCCISCSACGMGSFLNTTFWTPF